MDTLAGIVLTIPGPVATLMALTVDESNSNAVDASDVLPFTLPFLILDAAYLISANRGWKKVDACERALREREWWESWLREAPKEWTIEKRRRDEESRRQVAWDQAYRGEPRSGREWTEEQRRRAAEKRRQATWEHRQYEVQARAQILAPICNARLATWRAEPEVRKKTELFDEMPKECQEIVTRKKNE